MTHDVALLEWSLTGLEPAGRRDGQTLTRFHVANGRRRIPRSTAVSWALPHHGDPLPTCGTRGYQVHFTNAGAVHGRAWLHDCGRYECSSCRCTFDEAGDLDAVRGWESREANAIEKRIAIAIEGRHERGRPIHLIVSPDQVDGVLVAGDVDTTGGARELRHKAYRVAREAGFRGGAWIYHHYRVPGRFNERCEAVVGPHFHAIGFGWIEGTDDIHARTGWVVKNKGVRDSVFLTALYVLSHATRPVDVVTQGIAASERGTTPYVGLAVTWNGTLSYNAFPAGDDDDGPGSHFCNLCDRDIADDEWLDADPPYDPEPPDLAKCFEVREGAGWLVYPTGRFGRPAPI